MRFWLILLLLLPTAHALENTMSLLAVSENEIHGSIAELELEIRKGDGKVLLETTPLSKIDTQFSTKFANAYACEYLKLDCSNLDFIYSIKSDAPIVGGPSAGSAIALMTIATIQGYNINDISITGTLNSGGIIGNVGGVKQKIEAAKEHGVKKVFIPLGKVEENESIINLTAYGEEIGIEVVEVITMDEVIADIAKRKIRQPKDIEIDSSYIAIMKNVSEMLCQRMANLTRKVLNSGGEINLDFEDQIFFEENYYSTASKCFSNSIQLRTTLNQELSKSEIEKGIDNLEKSIYSFEKSVDAVEVNTLGEIQTRMIVKERITDALNLVNASRSTENIERKIHLFSFATERFFSAVAWSEFFKKQGKELEINNQKMKTSCSNKINEASERYQYITSFFPHANNIRDDIERAKTYYGQREFALCIHTASLAKADADVLMGSIGLDNRSISKVINSKLQVAKQHIVEEQEKGVFPIAGYSYYEYASNLAENDKPNALLFSQYALELSTLDLEEKKYHNKFILRDGNGYELLFIYTMGIITGIIVFLFTFRKI